MIEVARAHEAVEGVDEPAVQRVLKSTLEQLLIVTGALTGEDGELAVKKKEGLEGDMRRLRECCVVHPIAQHNRCTYSRRWRWKWTHKSAAVVKHQIVHSCH